MKFIIKYMYTATVSTVLLFSAYMQPVSLVTTTAWLKCKLGLSVTDKKTNTLDTLSKSISFENDLLDAIETYSIPQSYSHWAVRILKSLVSSKLSYENTTTKSYCLNNSSRDIFENLEFYEKVIQTLDLDKDDTYQDACEALVDLIDPEADEDDIDIARRDSIIKLFHISIKKNRAPITIDEIENNTEFEHIKSILCHATLLTGIFEKIGKDKLTNLWKTIIIKANGVVLPHNYITQIPVANDICTISATLPIQTFAQLLDAQGLRCIMSDEPIPEDSPCLVDTQKFLQEHSWIRSGIQHLQKHDSIWNSFIARYINMQVVFTYTFNVREFESDTIRINYLLLSQLNKWAHNPPAVTTRYRPFQTIEIIVNNKDT